MASGRLQDAIQLSITKLELKIPKGNKTTCPTSLIRKNNGASCPFTFSLNMILNKHMKVFTLKILKSTRVNTRSSEQSQYASVKVVSPIKTYLKQLYSNFGVYKLP